MQKALLRALLMPLDKLRQAETALDFTTRFTITEELKDMPYGAVWNEFCSRLNVPSGQQLIKKLDDYQQAVAGR